MDNKDLKGQQDRDRVAGGEDYEVNYIAGELGVTAEEVREAIKAIGNDREKITQYLQGK